jgi:uncharacterized membrane protein YccC
MTDSVADHGWTGPTRTPSPPSAALSNALRSAGPPLLFGLRLWASVCLALYVAFWLELDDASWAGTTAAIVCQPQLGASLRKGWFRMIGTLIGATMIVALTAGFPQNRVAFLGLLAAWGGVCAFAATLLRNFASYAAGLAGFTAAIIAADMLGATGGANTEVFMLAVTRASEICIGIVCAGVVLAGTDFGGAQRHLAASFTALAAEITGRFAGMLALAGPQMPDTQPLRRELVKRTIALDSTIDEAIGESSQLRYHSPILQTAVHGLFEALNGWRSVATHLRRLPQTLARREAETILRNFPGELRSPPELGPPIRWTADPLGLRYLCEEAIGSLRALSAGTPSLRLLADETVKLLVGILQVLDALALLVDAPGQPLLRHRGFRLSVPDWLPAYVNAARAFVTIGAVELLWIATAWPNGALAFAFAAIVVVLLSPRGDQAYAGALVFMLGTAVGIVCAAIIKFAVLPGLETFPAFCIAIGLYLVPVGFGIAQSRQPGMLAFLTAMAVNFIPVLAPNNLMSYDTAQFYNLALAILIGSGSAALSFRLLPPLSPAWRTERLLALTLRDLRRLAIAPVAWASDDWDGRVYGRLGVMPDEAEPRQRAQLLTALSVGSEILKLCRTVGPALSPELDAALIALAQGNSAMARRWLSRLDQHLISVPGPQASDPRTLQTRASILAISEALAWHADYFNEQRLVSRIWSAR